MPPKKADPFNFDAEFLKAGATGFVKQSMAEMKQATKPASGASSLSQPSPVSAGISGGLPVSNGLHSSTKPPAQQQPRNVYLPAGSLDFLDGLSNSGSAKAQPKAAAPVAAADPFDEFGSFSASTAPAPAKAAAPPQSSGQSAAGADPFAMFDDVPGAQVIQPVPKVTSPAHNDGFLAFDDAPAPFTVPPPQQEPVRSTAYPAVPSATSTLSPTAANGIHVSRSQGAFPAAGSPPVAAHKPSPPKQQSPPTLPVSRAPAASPQVPAAAAAAAPHARTGSPGLQEGGYGSRKAADMDTNRSWSPRTRGQRAQQDWGYSSQQVSSSSAAVDSKGSSSGGGVMGMLRGFTQKAVKAAQAGLQQLETALEKMDEKATTATAQRAGYTPSDAPDHSSIDYDSYHRAGSQAGQQLHRHSGEAPQQRHDAARQEEHDGPSAVALTILALPQAERSGALALLRPRVRALVETILEQLTEGEAPSPALPVDIKTSAVDLSSLDSPRHAPQPLQSRRPEAARSGSLTFDEPPPDFGSFQHAAPRTTSQPQDAASHGTDQHDLLGMSPKAAQAPAPTQATFDATFPAQAASQPAAAAAVSAEDDLLGMHAPSTRPASSAAAAQPATGTARPSAVVDVDDMHDFFSSPGTTGAGAGSSAAKPASTAVTSSRSAQPRPAAPVSPLMDLHAAWGDEADTGSHSHLYENNEGEEGEPELRKQLRAARLAEKHAKMRAALASKLAAEAEEARLREEQVTLKESLKSAVDTWKNKNKGNIRGLLGSLQNVLWEGSGWQPVGMGDLLEPGQIRKAWMKANLLVHPDKVRQRNGTPEQVARADMIFDVLKDAWNVFQSTGR